MKKILSAILVILLLLVSVPISANGLTNISVISFIITPNSTDSYGAYLLDMKIATDLPTDGYLYINFPSGFILPDAIAPSLVTVNGIPAKKVEISSSILKIYSSSVLSKDSEIVVRIDTKAMIKNPETPGDFGFLIGQSNESSPQNVSVTIRQGITNLNVIVQPDTSNSNAVYIINFYTSQNGALSGQNGDYITVSFPHELSFSKSTIPLDSVLINSVKPQSVEMNNNILTLHIGKNTVIPANGFVSVQFSLDAGIVNPSLPGEYFISVLTNKDPFFVNTVYTIKGTSISNLEVFVNPRIQNAISEIKISFITSAVGMLNSGKDKIFVEFPKGFVLSKNPDFSSVSVNGISCKNGTFDKNLLTITVPADIKSGAVTVEIKKSFGIKNPSAKGEYVFVVYTSKDLTPQSYSIQIEPSHISAPIVKLTNFGAKSVSGYDIEFYTGAGGALSKGIDSVTLIFPESASVPQAISAKNITVNGIKLLSSPVINSDTMLLKVPLDIDSESEVSIAISPDAGIRNPVAGGIYTLSVFTSKETTPVISTGFEISMLPRSFAKVIPPNPDGKNGYYITHPSVTLTAESPSDPNPAIYYYFDNNSPSLYSGDKIIVQDGIHTLHFYAIDHSGNKENKVNSIEFKVDTVPPEITIIAPTDTSVNGKSVKLIGKTEKGAAVTIDGDSIPVKPDGTFETILIGDGKTVFKIISTDIAGNKNEKTVTITFNNSAPINPPSLTVTSPQDGTIVYQQSLVITGKTDPGAAVEVNGESATVAEDGAFTITIQLKNGENTIDIVASKNGKNTEKKISVKYIKTVSMKLQIGNKNAIVNGEVVTLDSAPIIINNRTLVPLRFISESFGADVKWDPVLRVVQIEFNGTTILLQIGNKYASVNGKKVVLDSPPQIINGRTMVPLRFIVESFKAKVVWDQNTQTITITYP